MLARCISVSSPSWFREYEPAIGLLRRHAGLRTRRGLPVPDERRRPKRLSRSARPGAATGLLLARADGAEQDGVVGRQAAAEWASSSTWRTSRRRTCDVVRRGRVRGRRRARSPTGGCRVPWTSLATGGPHRPGRFSGRALERLLGHRGQRARHSLHRSGSMVRPVRQSPEPVVDGSHEASTRLP